MKQNSIILPEIKLVGISFVTNLAMEMNPATAKIGILVQTYFNEEVFKKISNRKKPGVTHCVYTNYESDFTGSYTFFIGEEVESVDLLSERLQTITIPAQRYAKFTTEPGVMPAVCIGAWQKIWTMTPEELGGARAYKADFEIYDLRAADHKNTVLDLYIGLQD